MFEPIEGTEKMSSGPKVLAVCAAGLLVSLGLCGAGAGLSRWGISGFFYGAGLLVLLISVIGLIVGFCMVILEWIANISRGRKD